jgi:uncharacterized protein
VSPRGQSDVPGPDVRTRLRRALRDALKARDMTAASALRSALGAIGNAEAVSPGSAPAPSAAELAASGPHFAGAVAGIGAADTKRRSLSEAAAGEIVRAEAAERQAAAHEYERAGHAARAGRLRREADVLMSVVDAGPNR